MFFCAGSLFGHPTGGSPGFSPEKISVKSLAFSDFHGFAVSYVPGSKLVVLGMGDLPPLIGNPYNGYINPYYWVDEFIPYYMEINGSLDLSTYG